jgi:hypothetical protein
LIEKFFSLDDLEVEASYAEEISGTLLQGLDDTNLMSVISNGLGSLEHEIGCRKDALSHSARRVP